MKAVLSELDERDREALAEKYLALRASEAEPQTAQDAFLFTYDLVDRKGRLTEAGLELAAVLVQSGDFAHLAPVTAPAVALPASSDLIAEVRALAARVGGLATLRCLINSLAE
jgi:hypothetical protein